MEPGAPPAERAFFGRRRGKSLRAKQAAALERLLPQFQISLEKPCPQPLTRLFGVNVREVRMEIGFGGGEHLLHRLREQPESGFIGVEPFVNGMAKLMSAVEADPPANLRVHDDDAVLLMDWLPAASLSGIDLLYPDPWPKKRHWKRRFISTENVDRIARLLKPGGEFRFASDIDSYVNWTLLFLDRHGAFEWQARRAADWHTPFPGWPGTRYEAKAIREGRRPAYLSFVRR